MAQALVRFLAAQHVERDGVERRFFEGCFGIFGHGNVAGIGQALAERPDLLHYSAQEIVTSIQEGLKLTIVLVDNQGYASIGALSRWLGTEGFGTRYLVRSSRDSLGDEAAAGDQPLPVDLALNAEGLGAQVLRARDLEEFRDALVAARAMARTVVVQVPADRYEGVPSYESWWDVPVSEVSEAESVREARAAYERSGADRRWYVTPSGGPR